MHPNETLLLTRPYIAALMTFDEYVTAVETAFRLYAEDQTPAPGVLHLAARDGAFHVKAASLQLQQSYVAVKVNGNFAHNAERFGLPTIQGVIVLCDGDTGAPLAIMDSIEITIQRTGAAAALAARHLARPDSTVATICGCGVQGRVQLTALKHVLPLERAYAYDRDPGVASTFAAAMTNRLDIPVEPVAILHEAAIQSDVIVTCSTAREPFLRRADVAPGTFVAAVGADNPDKQELESQLLVGTTIVVDLREQCALSGELYHAIRQGLLGYADVYAELGEILAGHKPGRAAPEEIIIFDSTGTALQDVAATAVIYKRAREANVGARCMMYPFVKTETGRFLKCMCLLPNRRTPWAFTCSQHCRLAPGGFVPLP
jgi:ornithine cyclodeaminase/alanine dehydrogenase